MEYDFIRSRLITDESDRVIWSVSGKDTKQAKERVLMTLIGNTLYWGEPSKTPAKLLDDALSFITHEVCRIPTFICISELKMKLAVAGC